MREEIIEWSLIKKILIAFGFFCLLLIAYGWWLSHRSIPSQTASSTSSIKFSDIRQYQPIPSAAPNLSSSGQNDQILQSQLSARDGSVRQQALDQVKKMSIAEQLRFFSALIQSKDYEEVNNSILIPMGERAVPALVEGLKHSDPAVRNRCCHVLARIGRSARAAAPALLDRARLATDGYSPGMYISILKDIEADDPATVQALAQMVLSSDNDDLRYNAIKTLGAFGQRAASAAPFLKQALNKPGPSWINKEIRSALSRMGVPEPSSVSDPNPLADPYPRHEDNPEWNEADQQMNEELQDLLKEVEKARQEKTSER